MFKTIGVITFRNDISRETALRYWRDRHAPLMLSIPGVVRYVQSHSVEQMSPGFDAIAELWFENREAYELATASKEWAAAVADNAEFIDEGRMARAVIEQLVVKGNS